MPIKVCIISKTGHRETITVEMNYFSRPFLEIGYIQWKTVLYCTTPYAKKYLRIAYCSLNSNLYGFILDAGIEHV